MGPNAAGGRAPTFGHIAVRARCGEYARGISCLVEQYRAPYNLRDPPE
jgi:hypothetical protein